MSSSQVKFLVAGDVNGAVGPLFKRVQNVMKKAGPFDALLCPGSFFAADGSADSAWAALLDGTQRGALPELPE